MGEKEISEKMQDIMKRMKNRREELNMSYQTLSEKVGISKSTLQRYETGYIKNMPVDKLEEIADALNISPAYLMGWEEPTPSTLTVHFDRKEYTEYEIEEIKNFAAFVKAEGIIILDKGILNDICITDLLKQKLQLFSS